MNKDKAIQLLERLQDPEPYEPMLTKDAYDAIQMAIDALSADGDTISRKAALDALDEIETEVADGYGYQYAKWREYFAELPSTQPEIIRCNYVKACNKATMDKPISAYTYLSVLEDLKEHGYVLVDMREVTT